MTKVQFAFQGGGAKIVELLAAVEAIHQLKAERGLEVTRVAGTSAGAFVAASMALGIPPAKFKADILSHGEKQISSIVKSHNVARLLWCVFRGKPIYNSLKYLELVRKLFSKPNGSAYQFKDCGSSEVLIYANNIVDGKLKRCTNVTVDDSVADAVFDSSCIPFIFSGFRAERKFVDGGLLRNFPTQDLLSDDLDKYGKPIGVSFAEPPPRLTSGIFSYAAAVAFSPMEYLTTQSREALGTGNTVEIDTSIGTLDFTAGLTFLRNELEFERRVLEIKNRIISILDQPKPDSSGGEFDKLFRKNVFSYVNKARDANDFKVLRRQFVYTCTTFASGRFDIANPEDQLTVTDEVLLQKNPLSVYSMTIVDGGQELYHDRISVNALRANRNIEVNSLSSKDLRVEGETRMSGLYLLFPKPPIPVGKESDDRIFISYSCNAGEPLSYLNKPEAMSDRLWYENKYSKTVGELTIIAYIPLNETNVELIELPERYRPANMKWTEGRQMSAHELAKLPVPPPNFRSVGWRAKNIRPNFCAGFMAARH